jgi:hypothetical protein
VVRVYRIYVELFEDSTVEQRRAVFNGIADLVEDTAPGVDKNVYSYGWVEEEPRSAE